MKKFYTTILFFGLIKLLQGQPIASFTSTDPSGCPSPTYSVTFTNTSTGNFNLVTWSTGESNISGTPQQYNTITEVYTQSGTYTVCLTVTDTITGQTSTSCITNYVVIFQPPTVTFTADNTVGCQCFPVTFTATQTGGDTTIASYLWILPGAQGGNGVGNPTTAQYCNPLGSPHGVILQVTDNNGCVVLTSQANMITVRQPVVANFTADQTVFCQPNGVVDYTNSTTADPATVPNLQYQWTFSGGAPGTSNASNPPPVAYNTCGLYDVQLVAFDPTAAGCSDTLFRNDYIAINNLNAAFNTNSSSVCISSPTVQFTDVTNNCIGTLSYLWDFGDGGSSTLANPSYDYTAPGCYSASLTVTNSYGCSDDQTFNCINVVEPPAANFSVPTTTICNVPAQVQFTNLTQPLAGVNFRWEFCDGSTSLLPSPTRNFQNCFDCNVRLIAFYPLAPTCRDTIESADLNQIIHIEEVNAAFTAAPLQACANTDITFNNNTVVCAPGATYTWTFGDGSTSGLPDPIHAYSNAGNYSVELLATTTNGCQDSVTINTINILPNPVVSFTAGPQLADCTPPLTVNFVNTTPNTQSLLWGFNQNDPFAISFANNPSYTYNQNGNYTVSLAVTGTNGCVSTLDIPNYVNVGVPVTNISATPLFGCIPLDVEFTESLQIIPGDAVIVRDWNFGDDPANVSAVGPTISHTYQDTGCFDVTYIVETQFGCIDTVVVEEMICAGEVNPPMWSQDTNKVCINGFVNFVNLTPQPYDTLIWHVENAGGFYLEVDSVRHQYQDDTICYTVELIAGTNGCYDTLSVDSAVCVLSPLANFSSLNTCGSPNNEVTFTDLSGDNTNWWHWDFGVQGVTTDTAIVPDPVFQFPAPGTYTVELIVQDTNVGCADTLTRDVTVGALSAAFGIQNTDGCAPFNVQTTGVATGLTSYTWSSVYANTIFGQNTANGRFRYTVGGSYIDTLQLIISDAASGCLDTFQLIDTINVYDVFAGFEHDSILCHDLTVAFTDTSSAVLGAITEWRWNMGDNGPFVFQQSPSYTYLQPGNYTVSLRVRDLVHGCADTRNVNIYLSDPLASFSVINDSLCLGDQVNLDNTSQFATQYIWSANPGAVNPANGFEPVVNYPTAGVIPASITLVAVDPIANCQDTSTINQDIYVSDVTAQFTISDTIDCVPAAITYTDVSTTILGAITDWQWNLNIANFTDVAPGSTHTVTYLNQGPYPVSLAVRNDFGCVDTANFVFTATSPGASFTVSDTTLCLNTPGIFTNTSVGAGLTFTWNFGDGTIITTNLPDPISHAYTTAGNYVVSLNIVDAGGCQDSATANILVPLLIADFTATNTNGQCPPLFTPFQDQSTGQVVNWDWDFGNGTFGFGPTYTAAYFFPGQFDVTLIVTDIYGCLDTMVRDSFVSLAGPIGTIEFTPDSGCINHPVTFTIVSGNSTSLDLVTRNGTYQLNMPVNDTLTFTHVYNLPGEFVPFMVLEDAFGCQVAYFADDTVVTESLTTSFTNDLTFSCDPDTANMSAYVLSSEPPTITWTLNGGGVPILLETAPVNDTVNAIIGYPNPGNAYSVQLVISNSLCSDTFTVPNITIAGEPSPLFTFGYPDPCQSQIIDFTNLSTTPIGPIVSYDWNFGDGTTSNDTSVTVQHIYPPVAGVTQDYIVTLTTTNSYGCVNTFTDTVTVFPLITPTATGDTTICIGGSATLIGTGSLLYAWSPPINLNCLTCDTVIASPTATTIYTVVFSNGNGCTESQNLTVEVHDIQPVVTPLVASLCIGQSVQLTASDPLGVSYVWTPAAGLNNPNIPNPVATPLVNTTYQVVISDAIGCSDSAQISIVVNLPATADILGGDTTICPGQAVLLNVVATGTGPYAYQWDPSRLGLTGYFTPTPVAEPLITTTYVVTVTDANFCQSSDSTTITVINNPPYTLSPPVDSICPGQSVQLSVTPANVAQYYFWTPNNSLNNPSISNPIATPTESTAYFVTMGFANGCVVTDTLIIWLIELEDISAGLDTTICLGDSIQLQATGSGNLTYDWQPAGQVNDPTIANPLVQPTDTTAYYLTVDKQGCIVEDTVVVNVITETPLIVANDTFVCIGNSVELVASGATDYSWTPAATLSNDTIANPIASPTTTTTYNVTGSIGACAAVTLSVDVEVLLPPVVTITASRLSFYPGESVELEADPNGPDYLYAWTPAATLTCDDCFNPSAFPTGTTVYTVVVTDSFGCAAMDTIELRMRTACSEDFIVVPNGFTPNGDGLNDVLYVRGISDLTDFRVFDRWGSEVFHTANVADGWDGTKDGKNAQAGVYVWYLVAPCPIDGHEIIVKGNVTLIR